MTGGVKAVGVGRTDDRKISLRSDEPEDQVRHDSRHESDTGRAPVTCAANCQYAGALIALAVVFGGVLNLYKATTLENKEYANEAATMGGVLLLVGLIASAGVAWLLRRGRRTS